MEEKPRILDVEDEEEAEAGAETPKRNTWLLPSLALVVIVGGWLTYRLMFPPFTHPVLPVPNGYDDLLRAAEMLAPRTGFYDEMGEEELASVVEQNKRALKLAHEALQKECMVPVNWSAEQDGLDEHLEYGSSLRGLARGFMAAARRERNVAQYDKAVRHGLDALELAPAVANGGLVIDRQMATAVYYNAVHSLREQVEKLSRDDCLRLQEILQSSPLQLEAATEVIRRDLAFMRQIHGTFGMIMMSGMVRDQKNETLKRMEDSDKQAEVRYQLLQTHLALRAFRLDKKKLPEKLDELVPDYLGAVPQDSFVGEPLIYRPQGVEYLLYSVGPNGVDDQGVETTAQKPGDVLLEVDD